MNLPSIFAQSVYSPSFYRSLERHRLSFSIKYFFLLAGTFAFTAAVFYAIAVFPPVYNWLKNFGPAVVAAYPKDLVLQFEGGEIKTNSPQPLDIPLSATLVSERFRNVNNLLHIDTTTPFSLTRFDEADTLVWLMKDSVAFRERDGSVRIQSLQDLPNARIDRDKVVSYVYQIEGVTRIGFPLLILLGVVILSVGFLAFLSFHLLFAFIWAALITLVASFSLRPLSYMRSYQVALHASSLSVVLAAGSLFFPGIGAFRFLPTVLTLAIAWANLRPRPEEEII